MMTHTKIIPLPTRAIFPHCSRYQKKVLNKSELKDEIDLLERELTDVMDSPVVFCHNDLLVDNIVYNKIKGETGGKIYISYKIIDKYN